MQVCEGDDMKVCKGEDVRAELTNTDTAQMVTTLAVHVDLSEVVNIVQIRLLKEICIFNPKLYPTRKEKG